MGSRRVSGGTLPLSPQQASTGLVEWTSDPAKQDHKLSTNTIRGAGLLELPNEPAMQNSGTPHNANRIELVKSNK